MLSSTINLTGCTLSRRASHTENCASNGHRRKEEVIMLDLRAVFAEKTRIISSFP